MLLGNEPLDELVNLTKNPGVLKGNGQLFEFCNASRDVSSIQNAFGGTFGDDVYAYVYVYGVEGEL